jgi:hypothetical protein
MNSQSVSSGARGDIALAQCEARRQAAIELAVKFLLFGGLPSALLKLERWALQPPHVAASADFVRQD